MKLQELRQVAASHCSTCPHNTGSDPARVLCDGVSTPYGVGKCKLGKWDHSAPVKFESYVYICPGHHLKWPVATWQRIQAFGLHGGKYRVPRAIYDAIRDQRYDD
jgi:hypothetical protein